MQSLNYKNFRTGVWLSFIIAVALFVLSYAIGKNDFFLLLNRDLGSFFDYFFRFFSFLAEGYLWVALLIFFIFSGRIRLLPLLVSSFVFTTLFTQVCKYFVYDELRPSKAITGVFHAVKDVTLYSTGGFPSGHTGTAFTVYLLFCLVYKKKWWVFAGLVCALLVGYSRIYLAEHFPFDVAGGIITAILSVSISILIQKMFDKPKTS